MYLVFVVLSGQNPWRQTALLRPPYYYHSEAATAADVYLMPKAASVSRQPVL